MKTTMKWTLESARCLHTKKEIEHQFMGKSLEKIIHDTNNFNKDMIVHYRVDIRSGIGNREDGRGCYEEATKTAGTLCMKRHLHRNICRKLRNFSSHRHAEDAISVHRIVAELKQESPTPVLLYKPQGVTGVEYP